MQKRSLFQAGNVFVLAVLCLGLSSCNFKSNDGLLNGVEDSSASGVVAGLLGGAILAGNPTTALSDNACPTVNTAAGAGCTTGTDAVKLTYSGCTYGQDSGSWSGTLQVANNGLTCATATLPSAATFQYVSGSSPSSGVHTSTAGTQFFLDDATTNLGNFDSFVIAPTIGSGYGVSMNYTAGAPDGVATIHRRMTTVSLNYSVTGTAALSTASGTTTVGVTSMKVYNNRFGVVGTSAFTGVTYDSTCCYPVSGSIQTSFTAGTTVTTPFTQVGLDYVGKSETLTFSSTCGSATLLDPYGYTSNVTLTHCY